MGSLKIVEYEPKLAAAVARMWTDSQENWGGSSAVRTEQEVLQQEANSSNLNLYIAMDGDKAVGYCGLSEYKGDEGALYIPLLNVLPEYHGKKIGKQLVLKAVERTIELGWPRLDLYTWPGNTKAVPLYKKCGFFWEERDEATHLMNYIPSVLATEAVQDFFQKADWYKDSTRPIEVKPDGYKENGFDYFEYRWEAADGEKLRVEFERKGRGIRLIETDEFLISAAVENLKRVAGGTYPIRYDIVNKSEKPLEISLDGIDDKNIMFTHFSKRLQVEDRTMVEGTFEVGEIEDEQNPNKTHPTVKTRVKINGKEAVFKTGIMPKHPANVSIQVPATQTFAGSASQFYLNIENNVPEAASFSFTLPDSQFLHLEQRAFQVNLEAKGKRSLAIPYRLSNHGFYAPDVKFTVATQSGKELSFTKKVTAPFKGLGARFTGESDEYWHIYNGLYHVLLDKNENLLLPGRKKHREGPSLFFFPKLGKPFSEEFSRIKPESVEFLEEKGTIGLKAVFRSQAFQGLQLVSNVKLYGEGMVEQWYEVENLSGEEPAADIWLYNWIYHELYKPVLPYENQIVAVDESVQYYHEYWESDKITENWLFSRHDRYDAHGICWSGEDKVRFEDWFLFFEHNLGKLPAGESVQTKPTFLSIGAFQDWQDFRSFALQKAIPEHVQPSGDLQLSVNDHNPVVGQEAKAVLREAKSSYLNGSVTLKAGNEKIGQQAFTAKDQVKNASFDVDLGGGHGLEVLNLEGQLVPQAFRKSALVLKPNGEKVQTEQVEKEGLTSYEANNGLITIRMAPEFFPALYSLESREYEWLHHSFPQPVAKSWWNPWPGGIGNHFSDLNANSLAKGNHSAEFTTLKDHHGNEWSGLAMESEFPEHEDYKGLTFKQYFVMLPGVPLVCHTTEIVQNTGEYFHFKQWLTDGFLNADWVKEQENNGKWQQYVTRQSEIEVFSNRSLVYGTENQDVMLQVVTDFDDVRTSFYLNKEATTLELRQEVHAEDGERFFTNPVFFLMTGEIIPAEAFRDLKNLRFGGTL
ncbi:MAG TPA: GNAT family N-acetyltransferase [Bacillales bacterium]|nr:GNAT family N-acetyltransferase [Bacillales bacterium]